MLAFTILLCNGEPTILFVHTWSINDTLDFVTLGGLFLIGKILLWKTRLKKSQTSMFRK